MNDQRSARYCGREFTAEDLAMIRELIASDARHNRVALSRIVCEKLGWLRPDGQRKDMSCRVAMLRMHRDGLITLPPPRRRNGNGKARPRLTQASAPGPSLECSAGDVGELTIAQVSTRSESSLWNELIERYHYLGFTPLAGAQLRYFVRGAGQLLAALGYGASAWKCRPRDAFIGWSPEQRVQNLQLVVNNARFLIVPWVRCKNLASRILGRIARRLPLDWEVRYRYRPVLLETFCEQDRFLGTCYRAANWIHLGQTQGRGKLDHHKRYALPVKAVLVYPLTKDFRGRLCTSR